MNSHMDVMLLVFLVSSWLVIFMHILIRHGSIYSLNSQLFVLVVYHEQGIVCNNSQRHSPFVLCALFTPKLYLKTYVIY
jgi:hypothetical protein